MLDSATLRFFLGGREDSDKLHKKHGEVLRTEITGPLGQASPFLIQRHQDWKVWARCSSVGRELA